MRCMFKEYQSWICTWTIGQNFENEATEFWECNYWTELKAYLNILKNKMKKFKYQAAKRHFVILSFTSTILCYIYNIII